MPLLRQLTLVVLMLLLCSVNGKASTPAVLPNLKGIAVNQSSGLSLDFVLDENQQIEPSAEAINELVRVFLAGITFKPKAIWVNLSPFEAKRLMDNRLATTDLGKLMLEQDNLLKQRASRLTDPSTTLGQRFWLKGGNGVTRVWIVPSQVTVYHQGQQAMLGGMKLSVLVEADYLAMTHGKQLIDDQQIKAMRELICPVLEREVNEGVSFAPLRAIYRALVLGLWIKKYHGQLFVSIDYANQAKVKGIDLVQKPVIDGIYQQYQMAYKNGVYNIIKEEKINGDFKPVKYFSGGLTLDPNAVNFIDTAMVSSWLKGSKGLVASVVFAAIMSQTSSVMAANNPTLEDLAKQKKVLQTKLMRMEIKQGYYGMKMAEIGYWEGRLRREAKKQPTVNAVSTTNSQPNSQRESVSKEVKLIPDEVVQQPQVKQSVEPLLQVDRDATVDLPTGINLDNLPQLKLPDELVNAKEAVPASSGGVGSDDPNKNDWRKGFGKTIAPPQTTQAQTPTTGFSPSITGETSVLSSGDYISQNDISVAYQRPGRVSYFGGLRMFLSPQMSIDNPEVLSEPDMMANQVADEMAQRKDYDLMAMPYLGLHKAGRSLDYFTEAELSDGLNKFPNLHLGIESRPVYNKGWNYTYGLSGIGYAPMGGAGGGDDDDRYKFALMSNGYLSARLSKLFGSEGQGNWLDRTYLSTEAKIALGQEGLGLGGDVKLTYMLNDYKQVWLMASLSPFNELPMLQEMMGAHGTTYQYSLTAGYQFYEGMSAFLRWGEPIGRMNEKQSPSFWFGLQYELGRPLHGGRKPVDYLRRSNDASTWDKLKSLVVPPDKSMFSRREFISASGILGFASLLSSKMVAANLIELSGAPRIEAVVATTPDSICGDPIFNLDYDDPLKDSHIVYVTFMYWYLRHQENDGIVFSSKHKERFIRMTSQEWDALFKLREIKQIHFDLVDTVIDKMRAEIETLSQNTKDKFKTEDKFTRDDYGRVLSKNFQRWMDRWGTYIMAKWPRGTVAYGTNPLIKLREELIKQTQANIQDQLIEVIAKLVDPEEAITLMVKQNPGMNSPGVKNNIRRNWLMFVKDNWQVMLVLAKTHLNKEHGYKLIINGEFNDETEKALIEVAPKLKNKQTLPAKADKAMQATGGIDFGDLPIMVDWQEQSPTFMTQPFAQRQVVGMTFMIEAIKSNKQSEINLMNSLN